MHAEEPTLDPTLPNEAQETASVGVSAFWGILAKGASVITNFLIGVIISRALGADGKGIYTFVQQLVGVLCVVLGFGLSTSNVFFVASKRISAKDATANTFFLATLTTIVSAFVLFLLLVGPFSPSPPYEGITVLLATLLFLASILYAWLGAVSIGLDGLKTQSKSTILSVSLTLILVVSLWKTSSLTPTTMLLVGAFAQAVGAAFVLLVDFKKMFHLRPNLSALKTMVPYSIKSYVVDLVGYLHLRQDVLILGWLVPMSSLGIYSIAVSFAEMVRYIPSILNAALFARISDPDDESGVQVSALLSRVMVVFVFLIAVIFALLSSVFIPFVYGEAFRQSIQLFLLLLPGTICISLSETSSAFLFSREVIYWKLSTVVVVLNIVLNLIFVPLIGITGAAIASSITYSVFSLGIIRLAIRKSGLGLKDFFVPRMQDAVILRDALKRVISRTK